MKNLEFKRIGRGFRGKRIKNKTYPYAYEDLDDKPLQDTMTEILQLYDKLTLKEAFWILCELLEEQHNQKKTRILVPKSKIRELMNGKDDFNTAQKYFEVQCNGQYSITEEYKTRQIIEYNKMILQENEKLKKRGKRTHYQLFNPREEYWSGEIDITFLKLREKYGAPLFQKIEEKKKLYAERKRIEAEEYS